MPEISCRIINRCDTELNWNNALNFIPKSGEIIIYNYDNNSEYPRIKIGDNKRSIKDLPLLHFLKNNSKINNNYDLNVKAINHRGYSIGAPENTIPAYIMSKEKGFTYVECDVSFTSDGVAVLLHDATIDRTSNGSGNISSMTYEYALQYDFGGWFNSKYIGTKIPTFTEFLVCCKRLGLHPYIELKSNGSYTQAQITQIVNEVELCGMKGKVTYISFSNTFLGYVKNADGSARLGLLANPLNNTKISQATALKNSTNEVFMDAKLTTVTTSLLQSCIDNKLPLEVWTVNDESSILNMSNYISGVTSDNLIAGEVLYNYALNYIPPTSSYIPATGISLNTNSIIFTQFDDTQTLIATLEPENASDKIIWTSSNPAIATVENGIITPKANGSCVITATAGSYSTTCTVEVDIIMYSITRNLIGCASSSSIISIKNNKSHTETINAIGGYKLDGAFVNITMGGVDISDKYNNGILTIDTVTGDISITIEAIEVPSFTITRNLTGCVSSNSDNLVNEGESLIETISAIENYELENATINITMGGVDISNSYDNSTNTITINKVTDNIVITIVAIEVIYYTITRNLTNCESSSSITSIRRGESHTEIITALDGYELNDSDIYIPDYEAEINNGVITILGIDGNVLINATAKTKSPIINLDLTSVTDNIITNIGSGGSTYNATISTVNNNDSYSVDTIGLTLNNHAYANMPYGFKASDKFTIAVKGSMIINNNNNFQRMWRTDQDAPSTFYSNAFQAIGAKCAGVSSPSFSVFDDRIVVKNPNSGGNLNTAYMYLTNNIDISEIHSYIITNNGTTISYYLDGKLMASQPSSSLKTSTYIGLGDNAPSQNYYADSVTIADFKVYNYTLNENQIIELQ